MWPFDTSFHFLELSLASSSWTFFLDLLDELLDLSLRIRKGYPKYGSLHQLIEGLMTLNFWLESYVTHGTSFLSTLIRRMYLVWIIGSSPSWLSLNSLKDMVGYRCLTTFWCRLHELKWWTCLMGSFSTFFHNEFSATLCFDHVCLLVGAGTAFDPRRVSRAIFRFRAI